jgi:hypothetical protein
VLVDGPRFDYSATAERHVFRHSVVMRAPQCRRVHKPLAVSAPLQAPFTITATSPIRSVQIREKRDWPLSRDLAHCSSAPKMKRSAIACSFRIDIS